MKYGGLFDTHAHYDHMGGMDDIRPYCQFGEINVYADPSACQSMLQMLPYCFAENRYPGVPAIGLHEILPHEPLHIGDCEIVPFVVMHGKLPILGYRIGKFAYITDASFVADSELAHLQDLEVLVVNALHIEKHYSHFNLEEALHFIEVVKPKHAYLIHVSHHMGLYADVEKILPPNVTLGYDGLKITIDK